jgi:hypothetical protein
VIIAAHIIHAPVIIPSLFIFIHLPFLIAGVLYARKGKGRVVTHDP